MDWQDRIVCDPNVCHGRACIKGTRIMASVILDNLAAEMDIERIIEEYPGIDADDIHAVMAYAADLASERIVPMPVAVGHEA